MISFRMDWLDLLGSSRDFGEFSPTPQFKSINSSVLRLSYCPTLTSICGYWTNHSFDYMDFVGKVVSLLLNTLSIFVIAFLPRSKHLLMSWLQSLSIVTLASFGHHVWVAFQSASHYSVTLQLSHFLDLPSEFPANLSICCLPEPTHSPGSHSFSLLVGHQYCCYHGRCCEHYVLHTTFKSRQALLALKLPPSQLVPTGRTIPLTQEQTSAHLTQNPAFCHGLSLLCPMFAFVSIQSPGRRFFATSFLHAAVVCPGTTSLDERRYLRQLDHTIW